MYIYLITNTINGKRYVGKCERPVNKTKKYMGSGIALKAAFEKYGIEFFAKEIIEENLTRETIADRERYWIKEFNTRGDFGYNLTEGGDGCSNPTDEVRKKISEKNKKYVGELSSRYGSKLTEEHKEILRQRNLGKPLSCETKKKISSSSTGRVLSDSTKKKMSESRLGKPLPQSVRESMKKNRPNKIKIQKIDKKTNTVLKTYDSLHDASEDTNISVSNISMCINGKLKSSGGYIWMRIN